MSSSDNVETNKVEPTSVLELRVRFPTGKFTQRVFEVPKDLRDLFPAEKFSALEILLHDGAFVEVDGFGLPFHNPGHDADDWINKGSVVASSMTFIDILRQRKWRIIVKEELHRFERLWNESLVPAPFTFPYGDKHWFDVARYESQLEDAVLQSSQFPMSLNFPDLPSMQAVLTQSVVQHHVKIAMEVSKIFATKLSACFVPSQKNTADHSQFFAIVSMEGPYCQNTEKIWREITKDGFLRLAFHDDMSPMNTPSLVEHKK
ncbi:hypothetical protein ACSS6W_008302 [Trichoderma asperelloides]